MVLAYFRMLIHYFLSKNTDKVTDKAPLIILDNKSDICMAKNGKDTKHTRHIYRRVHCVRNGENWKTHKIDWCGRGLHLAEIATKNVSDNDLNIWMKYIMVSIEKW